MGNAYLDTSKLKTPQNIMSNTVYMKNVQLGTSMEFSCRLKLWKINVYTIV
jgi:hypothetical protein